jgi:hypothetical protein
MQKSNAVNVSDAVEYVETGHKNCGIQFNNDFAGAKENTMQIKIFISVLMTILLLGCKNASSETDQFHKLCSILPTLRTPYNISCGSESDAKSEPDCSSIDSAYTMSVFPNSRFIGKLFTEQPFLTIMVCNSIASDYFVTRLYTFTQAGQRIDSLEIAINCNDNPGIMNYGDCIIYPNRIIDHTDSSQVCKFDSIGEPISDSSGNLIPDSTFIHIHQYKIDSQGHFVELINTEYALKGFRGE